MPIIWGGGWVGEGECQYFVIIISYSFTRKDPNILNIADLAVFIVKVGITQILQFLREDQETFTHTSGQIA